MFFKMGLDSLAYIIPISFRVITNDFNLIYWTVDCENFRGIIHPAKTSIYN